MIYYEVCVDYNFCLFKRVLFIFIVVIILRYVLINSDISK